MAPKNTTQHARIVIFGTPVIPGNRGVMALGASLVDLLSKQNPTAHFAFHLVQKPWQPVAVQTRNGTIAVEVVTCRMALKRAGSEHLLVVLALSLVYRILPFTRRWLRRKSRWIESIASASLVGDIRGGDSFSDIYGAKRFLMATLPILTAVLIRGRIVHFPQTYGPFTGTLARWVARATLRRSSAIVARDTTSRDYAQTLIGPKFKVGLSPDVAFRLLPTPSNRLVITPSLPEGKKTLIGININGLVLNGGYSGKGDFGLTLDYGKLLTAVVHELLKDPAVHVLLVPHTYAKVGDIESDNDAATKFRASLEPKLQTRIHEVVSEHDQHEIKAVVGMADFFIGSRMHACIAALSQRIPTVGIAYSRKFLGVFDSVGAGDSVVDATSASFDEAFASILAAYRNRRILKGALDQKVPLAQEALELVFEKIAETEMN